MSICRELLIMLKNDDRILNEMSILNVNKRVVVNVRIKPRIFLPKDSEKLG